MTTYSQIQKHKELRQLCMASKKKPTASIPAGYNLWDEIEDNNGFYSCVYQKENEIIIVYRSSDDINDWIYSNREMALGHMPDQAENAIKVYDMVNKFSKENNMKITVIGYSLGGSLAAIVSAMRGVEAVTFNAYGVRQLLNPNIKYYTNNITNYCNKFDPITKARAKDHIGKCYTVESKDVFKNPHYIENMDSLDNREEAYGPYLQDQYEREERSKKEFEEYKKYGRRIMRMLGLYSGENQSGCTGSYPVSGYTRDDGTKVDSYIRTCYLHGG